MNRKIHELQAATLVLRLTDTVKREFIVSISDTVFRSVSKTVLLYIKNEIHRFHTFVVNKVSEIQDSSSEAQWWHVPSSLFPADDCTQGLRASVRVLQQLSMVGWVRISEHIWRILANDHKCGARNRMMQIWRSWPGQDLYSLQMNVKEFITARSNEVFIMNSISTSHCVGVPLHYQHKIS